MQFSRTQLQEYRARYNSLPNDVDDAYEDLLKNPDHLRVIRGGLRIIKKHNANDFLGLFLLHRHFSSTPGSIFIERRYTPSKGHPTVLVTQGETAISTTRRIFPYRFSIDSAGDFQPLEFTTDIAVASPYKRFVTNAELLQELSNYLLEKEFRSIFGVGIFTRTGSSRKATSVFLEETKFTDRKSVVHILPHLPRSIGRAIPTLWTFGDRGNGCCSGSCVAYCAGHATPETGGYCGHRKGGHIGCV